MNQVMQTLSTPELLVVLGGSSADGTGVPPPFVGTWKDLKGKSMR
jgi:hypothetical protein